MQTVATLADKIAIENAMPVSERWSAKTVYEQLSQTAAAHPARPAISFQIKSGEKDKAETLSWADLHGRVTQAANLFRALGVGEGDVVAYLLPNANETAITLLAGATAGIVNPINPLLEPEQIASILRDTGAKVLVTLAPMPKTDVAEKAAKACALAPNVKTILEVDLTRYLSPPVSWIAKLIRPKPTGGHAAKVLNFNAEMAKFNAGALDFDEPGDDGIAAYFHTGGTTGMPKIAQHRHSGMIYNGWCAKELLFDEKDVLICPLPLFHVFAAYPILMACLSTGAHMVLPTPQGYRGEGVFDNFWKLVERYGVTFMITVPTAAAALMQRPVNADLSTLKYALCGSSPLPLELIKRFEAATDVKIIEGYGMTEATCLVSCNPPGGERKVGSVGLPMPYTEVHILHCDADGNVTHECDVDEIGEICVSNPGVIPGSTYTEADKNHKLFAKDVFLRTGDLGRVDADGYVYITGRAKDLIIRGGHNIDPALIEEALSSHPAVGFVGAIGQPDAYSGEIPIAYVELVSGAEVSTEELMAHAKEHITEHAAIPKYIEIMDELPKTAVGKTLKNELRKAATQRVFSDALHAAGVGATVTEVYEDKKRGLVAKVVKTDEDATDEMVQTVLGSFATPWEWGS
ncbi:acyl-CoA synthetase (AMP-forming)/AMP-acid ligase II [Rubricella aquisinus]|uniref:Acyl-CoA synthetase (AMP-forming)/AMP-acid ligase II n=1 Tax=Rubricella aquisinus TaxID=2028108 RepID=A0A840WY92_9RHOB|nr:acyl-CoA synthetase [Rubricella aquisinus]MBB5516130.1 acyl-CoA synthetase (AMP-forming)/AMP-acid ligase II [Rubricella aquisinus]